MRKQDNEKTKGKRAHSTSSPFQYPIFVAMSRTFAAYTLGCKLNFSETSTIVRSLSEYGFEKTEFHSGADIYLINTCSVTEHADKKCRKVVKEALRHNPNAFVAIIGCYAQLKPTEIAEIPGVDLVLGAAEKFNVHEYLHDISKKDKAEIKQSKIREVHEYHSSWSLGDRTRSFLKIQDGCDYFCTFCTIPLARGKSRSDTIQHVIQQAEEIVASGIKEIVLTGVNTGDFGSGTKENFLQLLEQLENVNGLERVRISSIEPNLLTDEIIHFAARSEKIVPHFHVPLQSGADRILSSMKRKYDTAHYASRIKTIRSMIPDCAIGVDVITGFPGETDEDFLETYRFLNELDITYLHVFTYSERPNTPAIRMPDKVQQKVRFERHKMLEILSDKKRVNFNRRFEGRSLKVLWEMENDGETMFGFTPNYIRVKTDYDPMLVNEIRQMKLLEMDDAMVMSCSFDEAAVYA